MKTGPTTQQREAAYAADADLCVDAGAGSGKTTVLVERIMHLLDRGVELRRIVAITFTRKAAAEMKERLREAIHRRPENDPRSMDKWRTLELEIESSRVTTIDSFCASLLHEHALMAGLDPDFSTLDQDGAALLRVEVVETALPFLLDKGDGPARRLVVEHGLERIGEFLSGAIERAEEIKQASRAYAGLNAQGLVTLWRTQADTLQRLRYEELSGRPEIAALAAELQRLDGACSKPDDKMEVIRRDTIRFLRQTMESGNARSIRDGLEGLRGLNLRGGSTKAWSSEEAMDAVKTAVTAARDLAKQYSEPKIDPEIESRSAQLTLDAVEVAGEIARAYREAKSSRAALDFSDLLALTVKLLDEQPAIRARVARGIEHLLIDEFQDTNHGQLELAALLSGEGGAKLFVVGDAKQSVYRFRGAEVSVFVEVKQRVRKTLPLDENFRSVAPLIAFINDFFRETALLARVEPDFHRLTARREGKTEACVEFLIANGDGPGEEVESDDDFPAPPREGEANLIAGRIAELCGPRGVDVYDKARDEWRRAEFGDVAILYRASTHSSAYEEALRKQGIPANVVAGAGFYARQEILDLRNLFSVALDNWDELALAAFLRSPLAGVKDDTLARMTANTTLACAFWGGETTGDAVEDGILERARARIEFIHARREWPVAALMRALLAETGFEAVLLAQYHGAQKAGNVHKLADLARGFGGAGRAGLRAFTDHLSALARSGLHTGDAELLPDRGGAVTLMSVHKAKGLEFPIVVVADTGRAPGGGSKAGIHIADSRHGFAMAAHDDEGATVWPAIGEHLCRRDKEDDFAEEARVLYVAMTRARDWLLLTGPSEPKAKSWMAAIAAAYGLENPEHGATVRGAAWAARVVRRTDGRPIEREGKLNGQAPSLATLRSQAAVLPSVIVRGQIVPVRAVLDAMFPTDPVEAGIREIGHDGLDRRTLGTAAHTLLERWDFAGNAPVEEVSREFFPAAALAAKCVGELTAIAGRLRISELWPRLRSAKELRRELPFLFEAGGVYLNGVMDAWLDNGMLVDYKLGARNAARSARYTAQLRLYAAAVRAATGTAPSEVYLYYLGSGELAPVEVGERDLDATVGLVCATLEAKLRPSPTPDLRR